MSNTINALKRLERAGSAISRATQKLFEAASIVAAEIEDACPTNVRLPRGYRVERYRSNVGAEYFLTHDAGLDEYGCQRSDFVDGTGGYLHGDFSCPIPAQTRRGVMRFAEDIATGLLDEIAAFLEARTKEAEEKAMILKEAKNV